MQAKQKLWTSFIRQTLLLSQEFQKRPRDFKTLPQRGAQVGLEPFLIPEMVNDLCLKDHAGAMEPLYNFIQDQGLQSKYIYI